MRDEWVLPAPPWPGVVQSSPPEVPKAMSPLPLTFSWIVPQLSSERTKVAARFESVPEAKMPAELAEPVPTSANGIGMLTEPPLGAIG